jgi:hypothetical protein
MMTLNLFLWVFIALGLGSFIVVKAIRAHRQQAPYRFGFLDGGLLFSGRSVNARWMIGVGIAYILGVSALMAWPLGFYRWVRERSSICRDLLTSEDVRRLGGPALRDIKVREYRDSCSLIAAPPPDFSAFSSLMVEVSRGYDLNGDLDRKIRSLGGTRAELSGVGDRAFLIDAKGDSRVLFVARGRAVARIHLPKKLYSEETARAAARVVAERVQLLDVYGRPGDR